MNVGNRRGYSVMPGEPHLGKQYETTVTVDRDEYMEALVEAFLNDCETVDCKFSIKDGDTEQEYTLGNDLTQDEIDNIKKEMAIQLLDDDYGSGKDYNLIYGLLDDIIPENWSDEFEIIEMV